MTYAQGYWDGYIGNPCQPGTKAYAIGYMAGTVAKGLTGSKPMLPCHHDSQTRETDSGTAGNRRD